MARGLARSCVGGRLRAEEREKALIVVHSISPQKGLLAQSASPVLIEWTPIERSQLAKTQSNAQLGRWIDSRKHSHQCRHSPCHRNTPSTFLRRREPR